MKVLLNGNTAISPIYQSQIKVIPNELDYLEPLSYAFLSRYAVTMRIRDPERRDKAYYESAYQVSIPESSKDIYFTVDSSTRNRIDIISDRFYGSSLQWWIIAMANELFDPFDIPAGTILRIPPLSSVYNVKGLFTTKGE